MNSNRFGFPLLLLVGVNNHYNTVLFAVAVIKRQTADSFAWCFQQMKSICGDLVWNRIKSIISDGDQAMESAINQHIQHANHMRCLYHLKMNLNHNLKKELGTDIELFLSQWETVTSSDTEFLY